MIEGKRIYHPNDWMPFACLLNDRTAAFRCVQSDSSAFQLFVTRSSIHPVSGWDMYAPNTMPHVLPINEWKTKKKGESNNNNQEILRH